MINKLMTHHQHYSIVLVLLLCITTQIYSQSIKNVLVGGLTDKSFVIKGQTTASSMSCDISPAPIPATPCTVDVDGSFFTINASDLSPKTEYTVKICEGTGTCTNPVVTRKVKTIDPTNFSFIVTSNIDSNSNSYILDRIKNYEIKDLTGATNVIFPQRNKDHLDFIIILGNIHSSPKDTDSEDEYIKRYNEYLFENEKMKEMLEAHPIIYFFNDRDFAGGSSDANSKGVNAINKVYRKMFPAYQLPSNAKGIYQSFSVGKTVFIMTDSRSFMDVKKNKFFGDEQTTWLKAIFSAHLDPLNTKQIFITVTQPWNYVKDSYNTDIVKQGYESLVDEISKEKDIFYEILKDNTVNFFFPKEQSFISVIMIIGERHLAFDNGNWNNHGSFPLVVCGPLDSWQQCRGGPYSHGSFHDTSTQYCLFNVFDSPISEDLPPIIKARVTSIAGVLADKDEKIGDQVVFAYNNFLSEQFPARVNRKCPMDWKEKILHAFLIIIFGVIFGFLFFFYFYWVSNRKLSFQYVKFKAN